MNDIIDSAILKKRHLTKNPVLLKKSWKDFEVATQDKKVILYGLGELLNFLWIRCNKKFLIVEAIDNDSEKQKHTLDEFLDESTLEKTDIIKISSRNILNNYNPNEVVILISSERYVDEIAQELEDKQFHDYFSVLHLEYNYREYMRRNHLHYEDMIEYLNHYANECAEKYAIQNKVIFSMNTYAEHGKYITEQLLATNQNIDIVWIIDSQNIDIPVGVRTVRSIKEKRYIYEMETAKVWIYGIPVETHLVKRKGQTYIFTKHRGNLTLKKSYIANKKNDSASIERVKISCKWIDYILSGCEFDENASRENYDFNGPFLRFGSPKSDVMFSAAKYKEKIYKIFNLNKDEHVLLYAPTFRQDNEKRVQDFKWLDLNFDVLINNLQQKWGGNWKIFLRLHPAVKNKSRHIKKPEYVIDVSNYGDGQELVAATDVMISDYSTIMFELSYIMKPVFLYAPDKDTYATNDRELFMDYDSLPFPISKTNEELAQQIKNFDEDKYKKDVQAFLNKYGVHEDGHASQRVAHFITKLLN